MDRTGKVAVAILIILIALCLYNQPKTPPVPPGASPSPTPAVAAAPGGQATPPPQTVEPGTVPAPTPVPVLPEKTEELSANKAVAFTFTNHGGGIARATLLNHITDSESKKNIVLNEYGPAPVGATSDQPVEGMDDSYTSTTGTDGTITYERTTADQIQITKKYTLPTSVGDVNQYITTLDITFKNLGTQNHFQKPWFIAIGATAPVHKNDYGTYIGMDWDVKGSTKETGVSAFAGSHMPIIGSPEKFEITNASPDIGWAGVHNQYFATIITPVSTPGTQVWSDRIPVDILQHTAGVQSAVSRTPGVSSQWWAINGALGMPGFDLAPGTPHTEKFKIYLGTREYNLLKHLDGGQVGIMQTGWRGPISRVLLKALIWLHNWVGGYAVAIIVLTIILKLLLWPLQNRATQSMKKMSLLNPKMAELREKYKDAPERLNQEVIKLYRAYGVNPFGGCLPMFIQLPIFFGFYAMLGTAIELRNSRFFWVHDLTQPDTIGHIPFLGWPLNILPLCMAATSAWMTFMTPKSGDPSQQRMMLFTPLIFLFICYNYASGLALYMMVSNLFSVVQFIVTKNQVPPTLEKVIPPGKKKK
ncbi:MAG TPA: YidC/Oxa1 family insertase periplasmic-domain containing protein [Chthoniobacteraceae bacterium]|nr:YidC/Oxa1 family insertase periplasmic-domain containing protein [Chthoniobacteraceae bacterium]